MINPESPGSAPKAASAPADSSRATLLRTFVRRHLPVIAAWPAAALLLVCLLWTLTLSVLERERGKVQHETMRHASSLAHSYAQQLERTVEHMDQVTLHLKYEWEEGGRHVNLERQREKGLYPPAYQLYASIVGRDGTLVTSTFPFERLYNFSDERYYQVHRANAGAGFLVTGPSMSRRLGTSVVHFSRRLDTPAGEFDGTAMVAVETSYLAAFQDESTLGRNDFVSVRYIDGPLLTTKIGQSPGASRIFYRSDPVFPAPAGVLSEPAAKFRDDKARFVAWEKLDRYPLVALAALSMENAFASYAVTARNYKGVATAGSLLLFLLAAVGALLSARLAWRRLQEEEIKQTYRLAVDAAREGFYMLRPLYDRDGRAADFQVEDCNERAAEMIGMSKADLVGRTVGELYHGEYGASQLDKLRRAFELSFYEDEVRVTPHSRLKVNWVHRKLVRSGGALALTIRDISDIKAHEQQLSNMANADALTALPNRNWLINYLPLAIERTANEGVSLAILFIDLDDFKNINDTLGHVAGDELLKAVAARVRALVRASDHVVRLGGDEFTVILEGVAHVEDVSRVARQIVDALAEPFTLGRSIGNRVHASIGISVFPQDGKDGETLLKHADVAMYAAKAAGKGRFHFYHAQLSDRLVLRLNREQALRQAIERDEFVLHYQPRVDTVTGKLCSMEALVRWVHPERGLVQPLEFIAVAEDTGLILALGRIVIEKACAQMARWKAEGLPLVPVSINVSALQFNEGNVKTILAASMSRHGVEASLIGVELTESCMAGEDETVSGELEGLRMLGVKLLVDDFGTGYSSLSQLQRLNVDILKVDRAFTLTLCEGAEGRALFKAIVSMADALDICIVAEGVETSQQLGVLQSLACDEVQGHLVSPPVPAEDMAQLMKKRFLFPPALQLQELVPG
jgi:diguanylate cyclase (GGDEF)-like protein/PAS domain S-box-containing protein